jgi:site-specific recombinase XerD
VCMFDRETDAAPDTVRDTATSEALATTTAYLHQAVASANTYADGSLSETTRRAYSGAMSRFEAWAGANSLQHLPATPATVAVYLAHLADSGLKVSTIVQSWAAIRKAHAERGCLLEEHHIQRTLAGIRRRLGVAPEKKAPITDLPSLLATCPTGDAATLQNKRDRAMILLGWFGAFRRSELVSLTVTDVRKVRLGLEVTLRRSKTDQDGIGTTKGIPFALDPNLCPVLALDAWLVASGITEGPLFREVRSRSRYGLPDVCGKGALHGRALARIVKRLAKASGMNSSSVSGHSLRSGFVTAAANKGKRLDVIMSQTGHKAVSTVLGYIHQANMFDAAMGLA